MSKLDNQINSRGILSVAPESGEVLGMYSHHKTSIPSSLGLAAKNGHHDLLLVRAILEV